MVINFAFFKAKYGGLTAKLIKLRTGGIHSHVELIFPQYTIYDSVKNRELSLCFSSYEKEGGVRFKFIYLNPEKWDIVPIEIPNDKLEDLLSFAAELCDADYDWPGIFGFVIPFFKENPKKFFCSEVLVYLFQKKLAMLEDLVSYKTSPTDLFRRLKNT
jgi:hypothetical protein